MNFAQSEPMMPSLIIGFGAGERVDSVILGMTAVSLHPAPIDPVRSSRFDELLPQVGVLHGLPVRRFPAVLNPFMDPARDPVPDVLAVRMQLDPARSFQRFKAFDRCE